MQSLSVPVRRMRMHPDELTDIRERKRTAGILPVCGPQDRPHYNTLEYLTYRQ